ncbi:MAG: putative Ig domain-containing protein, partial [Synergistaceae bacterium]|nr:putative Ig domain-containing protein [Synergistaceae bacterium]
GALPSGLAFSGEGSTASISGTPEAGTAGTYPVKVVAANEGGSASADVLITVASAGTEDEDKKNRDIEKGEPVTTVDASGASTTRTTTNLKDSSGNVILAAEIAITTESEEFATVVGGNFSTIVSVDVSLDIRSTSYDKYAYLMEIFGLPEWLKADGTLESSGKVEGGQHYEVTLSGTPTTSQDAQSVVFAATVMITGDTPEIEAYGDKEIMLAVNAGRVSPDVSPGVRPDVSPDVNPDADVAPRLTASQESLSVSRGESISVTITAVNGESITWSNSGSLPEGVNAQGNGNTFTISGTVTESAASGSYTYTVSAANSAGSASITITITVRSGAYEPVNEQETTADEINNMTGEQLQEKFGYADGIKITGKVENLNELVEKISTVTEIKALDLSEAEELEEVNLSGNSTIQSLTLAGNTTVKTIDVSGTKLAVLNADHCAGLTELRCANCNIEELDVEGCDSLEVLDCRNNKLHKLDAYMLESLYELLCSNQNITGWILGREFDFMEHFGLKVSAADGVRRSASGVENIKNLKAWDAEGKALTVEYDSATGKAVFGNAPAKIAYDYDTGFENVMMDVTVVSAGGDEPGVRGNVGPSGGGCDASSVNAALGMIAVMMFLAFRRKS